MHENISQSMENLVKLDSIELQSQDLAMSAGIFKHSAKELKNKMWWKNIKMKLILFGIFSIILTIIIVICVEMSKQK